MRRTLLLENCRPYDAPDGAPAVDVLVRDGVIAQVAPHGVGAGAPEAVSVDAGGRTLAPGLIDVHIHGAGGADALDGTTDALRTMARTLARHGTTGFLATMVPAPAQAHRHVGVAAAAVGTALGGARLLGLHLEGPFVNPERKGGLPLWSIYPPAPAALDELLAITDGTLRMMTVAPELDGGLAVVERLAAAGVVPSFGHSSATYDQTRAGIAAGITHVTHLYNAMPSLHHRAPGPIVAISEAEHVTVQLVSDGVHVDGRVIALTHRLLGGARCCCITDGMRTVGLPDGRYTFNGRDGESRDGVARYADGTLIGTALGLDAIAARFRRFTGCSFAAAIDSASRVPAAVLGLADRKGRIAPGFDADLVLFDGDAPWMTIVEGEVVFRRDDEAATAAVAGAGR